MWIDDVPRTISSTGYPEKTSPHLRFKARPIRPGRRGSSALPGGARPVTRKHRHGVIVLAQWMSMAEETEALLVAGAPEPFQVRQAYAGGTGYPLNSVYHLNST